MAGLQTMLRGLPVAALTFAACAPAHAETLTGTASVVDGDTLDAGTVFGSGRTGYERIVVAGTPRERR